MPFSGSSGSFVTSGVAVGVSALVGFRPSDLGNER